MYNTKQLQKAIKNPSLAYREVKRNVSRGILFRIHALQAEYDNRVAESDFGIVLHWGFHQRDWWTVAQGPFFINAMLDAFDPVILPSQRAYNRHKNELEYIFSFEPGFQAPKIQYDHDQSHTVGVFASDPHNKTDWFGDYVRRNDVDYVFTTYYTPFLRHFPDFDESLLVHFPWAVPDQFAVAPETVSFHDQRNICVFGATGDDLSQDQAGYYEVRDWCRDFPFTKDYQNSGYQEKIMSHEGYYEWLRNFDACVAAGSNDKRWDYVFAKYFEIPAAGCLLFAQHCDNLERLGFSEDNCVIFDQNNFKEKAERYLSEPETYLNRRKNGCRLIRERHLISNRIATIARELGADQSDISSPTGPQTV